MCPAALRQQLRAAQQQLRRQALARARALTPLAFKPLQQQAHGPVQPSIEATTNAFRIVLPNMNAVSAGTEIAAESKPAAPVITPQMKIVLDYLKEYGEMRDEELQELLHIKKTRAYLLTRQMNEEGLIKVVGRGAEKTYRLK